MFNAEEIRALVLGARIVKSCADTALATAADSVLSKIETVLPEGMKKTVDQTKLFAPMMHIHRDVASNMAIVRVAADNQHKIQLVYGRADGEVSERIIWPLGLFFWGTVWTIGAWCELRQSFRIFRLDRIHELEELDQIYPSEQGKKLADLLENLTEYEKKS
jgi:predicted DNA-binding transcriptional regulator YafY